VIHFREAGFQLWVPAYALTEETEITVPALAGSGLAVDLQPHGLQFALPVQVYFQKNQAGITDGVFGMYFWPRAHGPRTL